MRSRWAVPTPESFLTGIAKDEEAIKNAETDEERQRAKESKASKTWRMLRTASKTKLRFFDKVDDRSNLQELLEPGAEKENASHGINEGTRPDVPGSEPMDRMELSRDA